MTDPRKALKRIRKRANKASLMIELGPLSDEDWELCATAARVDVPRLASALEAALDLHKCRTYPDDGIGEPTACTHCDNEPWPCPTIRAITAPLEGEQQ